MQDREDTTTSNATYLVSGVAACKRGHNYNNPKDCIFLRLQFWLDFFNARYGLVPVKYCKTKEEKYVAAVQIIRAGLNLLGIIV